MPKDKVKEVKRQITHLESIVTKPVSDKGFTSRTYFLKNYKLLKC